MQATPLGERVCKTKNLDGRELMTLDYQKLSPCRSESRSWRRRSEGVLKMAEDGAMELLGRLARDFNVRDPRKL